MPKSSSFNTMLRAYNQVQKQQARAAREAVKAQNQAQQQAERQQRANARAAASYERERARLRAEGRAADAAAMTRAAADQIAELEGVLAATLTVDDFLDFSSLKDQLTEDVARFDPGSLGVEGTPPVPPDITEFAPPPAPASRGRVGRLVPGAGRRETEAAAQYERQVEAERQGHAERSRAAQQAWEQAVKEHEAREADRKTRLDEMQRDHEQAVAELRTVAAQQNEEIDRFRDAFDRDDAEAVASYFDLVVGRSLYPESFPDAHHVVLPEPGHLVVNREMPSPTVMPDKMSYRYVKARDEIDETDLSPTKQKSLYTKVLAQMALRSIHEVLEADRSRKLTEVTFNGYVPGHDRATGAPTRLVLASCRTKREDFEAIELMHVDPVQCFKSLKGRVSTSPLEAQPVTPFSPTESA